MTSRDFCYWLQGFFEISGHDDVLTLAQSEMIQKHLALVFKHEIDPSMGSPEHQAKLNDLHNRPTSSGGTHAPLYSPLIRC